VTTLVVVIGFALAFGVTTGFQDGANSVAATVATRAARPASALALAALGCILGPLIIGGAVARTVATLIDVPRDETLAVVGAALSAAVLWNLVMWRLRLPSSASHALVGGLVGAALADAGAQAVNWGGFAGWRPVGVIGVLVFLAVAPVLGVGAGAVAEGALRGALAGTRVALRGSVRAAERVGTFALATTLGANDGAKAIGVIALVLVATGHASTLDAPTWVRAATAVALGLGAVTGGLPIARTLGRRVFRVRSVDGLSSQSASVLVAVASSAAGAPVSTSQIVASSVVGVGVARHRWRHVSWNVVAAIAVNWVTTLPGCAALGAVALVTWRALA
jgi:inorganic phosphate transporter, PiT family